MTRNRTATVDQLWQAASRRLPEFSPDEQRAGIVLLKELARGQRLRAAQLADALGTSLGEAEALLRESGLSPFVHAERDGRVVGFWGLSTVPLHHRFAVNGRPLWTWGAVTGLFLPELLGKTARVESRDPEGGELVRLTITPTGIECVEPTGVAVSMLSPDAWEISSAAKMITASCHFVFFFTSRTSGERWVAKHPKTVLLSLEDAFAWGKRENAQAFGTELVERSV